jgi:serine kinase of HPr protein (carbohydrate metabolism regulator)
MAAPLLVPLVVPLVVHATAVAIDGRAVLLRGPSGAGKSDFGLRLIDAGACLVSDDQCELRRDGDRVLVRAPATILGLLEIRGIGIVRLPPLSDVPLALIADLVAPDRVERLPEPRREPILGLDMPVVAITPFEASAVAKLRAALLTPPEAIEDLPPRR